MKKELKKVTHSNGTIDYTVSFEVDNGACWGGKYPNYETALAEYNKVKDEYVTHKEEVLLSDEF